MKPTKNLKKFREKLTRIRSELSDMECGGLTVEFLSEWTPGETGTAQHAVWTGCTEIVKLCDEINDLLNMAYPHPIVVPSAEKRIRELEEALLFIEMEVDSENPWEESLNLIKTQAAIALRGEP